MSLIVFVVVVLIALYIAVYMLIPALPLPRGNDQQGGPPLIKSVLVVLACCVALYLILERAGVIH